MHFALPVFELIKNKTFGVHFAPPVFELIENASTKGLRQTALSLNVRALSSARGRALCTASLGSAAVAAGTVQVRDVPVVAVGTSNGALSTCCA